MSSSASLAKRYVKALFELADSMGKIDVIAHNLANMETMIGESDDLRNVIMSSAMSRDDQAKIMLAVLTKSGADDLMIKFVGTICKNGRLFALPQMIKSFLADLAKRRGEISAEVISAVPLDASHEADVMEAIASVTKSDKIALETSVDPSLIGGLVVRIGSRMIDTSIKTKLNRLEAAMKGVG
ncbi:MAG: F0F1 ATP synthase subunit delta [Candidatus Puniceispirillales bacterium]